VGAAKRGADACWVASKLFSNVITDVVNIEYNRSRFRQAQIVSPVACTIPLAIDARSQAPAAKNRSTAATGGASIAVKTAPAEAVAARALNIFPARESYHSAGFNFVSPLLIARINSPTAP
jgi:hypothetical protein